MFFQKVLKNYSQRDRTLSALLAGVIMLVLFINIVQGFIYNNKISDRSGVYSEGAIGQLQVLNPLFRDLNSINRDISSLIYSGLTKYNPQTKSFEPDLATFTINADSSVYTFTLKENIYWHDGEPVTVEDIIYTYRTVIQNPGFQNSLLRQSLEGVEIENTAVNQVEFRLKSPNAFFISQTDLGILPKHIYQDFAVNEIGTEIEKDRKEAIIGSGPFELDQIDNLEDGITRVSLKPNRDYYGIEPKVKQVRFFLYPDAERLISNQDNFNTIVNLDPNLKEDLDSKFKTKEFFLPQYNALFLNTDNSILQDRTVRVVLKRAADTKALGALMKNKQIVSRPFFQFEAINDISQTNPNTLQALLEDEGWEEGNDGIYAREGQKLSFELLIQNFSTNEAKNQDYQVVVKHLVDSYKKVGIEIVPKYYEAEVFARLIAGRDFDMVLFGHSLGTNLDSYSFWHSSQTGASGLNISNYKNIATDSLLDSARKNSNIDQRNEILVKINEKLVYDVPAIFLYTDKHVFAFDNKVKNRTILSSYAFFSDRFYDITNWELE